MEKKDEEERKRGTQRQRRDRHCTMQKSMNRVWVLSRVSLSIHTAASFLLYFSSSLLTLLFLPDDRRSPAATTGRHSWTPTQPCCARADDACALPHAEYPASCRVSPHPVRLSRVEIARPARGTLHKQANRSEVMRHCDEGSVEETAG